LFPSTLNHPGVIPLDITVTYTELTSTPFYLHCIPLLWRPLTLWRPLSFSQPGKLAKSLHTNVPPRGYLIQFAGVWVQDSWVWVVAKYPMNQTSCIHDCTSNCQWNSNVNKTAVLPPTTLCKNSSGVESTTLISEQHIPKQGIFFTCTCSATYKIWHKALPTSKIICKLHIN
jgi:hypothetical protein